PPLAARLHGPAGGEASLVPGRMARVGRPRAGGRGPAGLPGETLRLPRVAAYQPAWLDGLFRDSDLAWYGCGKERISFAFPEDLELFRAPGAGPALSPPAAQVMELLAAAGTRLDFAALAARSPLPSSALAEALWELSWAGRI